MRDMSIHILVLSSIVISYEPHFMLYNLRVHFIDRDAEGRQATSTKISCQINNINITRYRLTAKSMRPLN